MENQGKVRQVLLYTLILNIIVAFAKIFYGYSISSISMVSDGYHSFFDGTSNVIGLIGIWIASRPPDKTHPYGHRKFETLSTIAIVALIFTAGIEILRNAYERLSEPNHFEATTASFIIMGITLFINFAVMSYETKKGRELKSDFLIADALHTRSDIFISLSVVISLIAARTGYPVVDIIAALVITIFIGKMGYDILKSAAAVLTDAVSIDPDKIMEIVMKVQGVCDCHGIRTRGGTDSVHLDLHILVDPHTELQIAHEIAHIVEEEVKKSFPSIIDAVIHVEPFLGKISIKSD